MSFDEYTFSLLRIKIWRFVCTFVNLSFRRASIAKNEILTLFWYWKFPSIAWITMSFDNPEYHKFSSISKILPGLKYSENTGAGNNTHLLCWDT